MKNRSVPSSKRTVFDPGQARVLGVEYTGEASLRFAIPPRARAVAEEIIAELTSGASELRVIGQRWVDSQA